jgi:MoaA/NifB/PqqE/SkfB family radical SAM enzyme
MTQPTAGKHLHILYRGPLKSCNYACSYCPFAKRKDGKETLERDAAALACFTGWIERQDGRTLSVLFTPWGEALIRPHYRAAIASLSHMPQVGQVAIQTNLSCPVDWMAACNPHSTAFWCTFHPSETALAPFLEKCARMDRMGLRYSVGVVGRVEHFGAIAALREALPPQAYLWINAFARRATGYYTAENIEFLATIDPLFELNLKGVRSRGRACLAGETAVAVDGDGAVRRCHFTAPVIGNLYDPGFEETLRPRPCPKALCICHTGYAFMPELGFETLFGRDLAHRIPCRPLRREYGRRQPRRRADQCRGGSGDM